MKKIIVVLFFSFLTQNVWSQYDPKALEILDVMSQKYKNIVAYTTEISSNMVNKMDGIDEKFEGKIWVKGEKYKLVLDQQIIFNNGNQVWTYLPEVNEVNIDDYEEEEVSPTKIYDIYKNGYKYLYLGSKIINQKSVSEIDLVPEDTDSQFFKIKLFISRDKNLLVAWTMFDKSGNQYRYELNNFKRLDKIDSQMFNFEEENYPDVEIIDLR